jgi:hypothetical protein
MSIKACRLPKGLALYVSQETWKNWHQTYLRRIHESTREFAMYKKLKKGPVFRKKIAYIMPRDPLVEGIKQAITPAEEDHLYPLIIGAHGTRKASLIRLAVNGMDEPKGVVYVDVPLECDLEV